MSVHQIARDSTELVAAAGPHARQLLRSNPLASSLERLVLEAQRPLQLDAAHAQSQGDPRFGQDESAYVGSPLLDGAERVMGVLGFSGPRHRLPDEPTRLEAHSLAATLAMERLNRATEKARSEEYLDVALATARMGVWSWDLDTDSVRWSNNVAPIFGLGPEQMLSNNAFRALLDNTTQRLVDEALQRCAAGVQEQFTLEHLVHLTDGRTRWVETRGRACPDASGKVVRIIGTATDVTERRAARETLIQEQALKSAVLNTSLMAVVVVSAEGEIEYATRSAQRILDLRRCSEPGRPYATPEWRYTDMRGAPLPREEQALVQVLTTGQPVQGLQHGIAWPDGQKKTLRVNGAPIRNLDGELTQVVFSVEDITEQLAAEAERAELQEQLFHSQKLEGIGRLAGGIAHDFNNLLTAILSYTALLRTEVEPAAQAAEMLEEIRNAATRAAQLTGQLLAFARRQVVEPRNIDLNQLVARVARMLKRLVGENVRVVLELAEEATPVRIDPGQMEQALVNLAVNARDAMPDGGTLTITTRCLSLPEQRQSKPPGLAAGDYVQVEVADTGVGMSQEVLGSAFEPFFTTKERGKGTGLGLATCHGIVRKFGGDIWVQSRPGSGTTFKLVLPRLHEAIVGSTPRNPSIQVARGHETVLIVEDDAAVRRAAVQSIQAGGYQVLQAGSGAEALEVVRTHAGPVDLLLTDVILPGMSGVRVAESLRPLFPNIKVLFVSGYADETLGEHGVLEPERHFLQKPYGPTELAAKVREVLES